ncbi:putative primosomal protein N' [Mobiluncus mulieris FB024-16]|uniref:primosomal protein N' family DNA-binding protein n=1 Tax=Mobiluncus mulieris TaxID=2052 RepID=UPI0001E51B62|nr:hypothetical protein [Mobiluncus mulieris]EFN92929.1 putative primosomal protein N' [Mobiluncus mulieris FB024-16]
MDAMLPLTGLETPGSRRVALEGVVNPVAAVLINTFTPQLSQPLDFLVPRKLSETAQVGCLVKVKVGGKEYLGVITARKDQTEWMKPLSEIRRVLTPWPLLDGATLELLESVSLHYGVGPAALLRYVLPTRRVKIEAKFDTSPLDLAAFAPWPGMAGSSWDGYGGGTQFLAEIRAGESPRAVVAALPQITGCVNGVLPEKLADRGLSARFLSVAELASTMWQSGRQSLLVFPSAAEAAEAYLFLRHFFDQAEQQVVLYTSQIPPAAAYEAFLKARFGHAAVIVSTRGGVFLPLARPGLCYCWDDTALSLSSDMFPNFSARQVLLQRVTQTDMALVLAHYSVSAGDLQLVERGFARKLTPNRETLRENTPRFYFLDWESQMTEGPTAQMLLPSRALRVARRALDGGPVLISVPPDGKYSVVSCVNCGENASCPHCSGPLRFQASQLMCSRCGLVVGGFTCSRCGSAKVRGRLLQSRTLVEDIGRMFPEVSILVSKPGDGHLTRIGSESRLVVAGHGGEPEAEGGYQAALILRAHMLASRTALWTSQEVMRRFLNVAALVAPGKTVFVTEPLGTLWEQSLIRWDPWQAAAADLRERQIGHFAPAWRTVLLQAPQLGEALEYLHQSLDQPLILGPVPSATRPGIEAAFVSAPLREGTQLGKALRVLGARFGIATDKGGLSIEVDPADPGGQIV